MNDKIWRNIDISNVKPGGEFGRRIWQFVEGNILKVDVQKTFLDFFQNRGTEAGYLGFGKFIDAVVWLAFQTGDKRLEELKISTISALLATQDPDGYIGIFREKSMRIKGLWDLHERSYIILSLVNDFHCFGCRESLVAAMKNADNIIASFQEDPSLRPDTFNGMIHFEATNLGCDLAMLALSEASGDNRYRDFVLDFLRLKEICPKIECGSTSTRNHVYAQLGHCLAQLHLYLQTPDDALLTATRNALSFMLEGDGMLITGSCSEGECWHCSQSGLQNTAETCVGFYVLQIMDAMLRIEQNSLYGDLMERGIYNAMFAANSPDARSIRYFTPFEGRREYDEFHGDSFCCPNNFRRFMSRLAGWTYYLAPDGVTVNLYNASTFSTELSGGVALELAQETDYPSSGHVRIFVNPAYDTEFTLRLRIPRWCPSAQIAVNGSAPESVPGGRFHEIRRTWKPGDVVELEMPMQWRWIRGRCAQSGRAALMRGPSLFTMDPARNPALFSHADFEAGQVMIAPARSAEPQPEAARNPALFSYSEFEPRQIMIDPARPVESRPDDSLRPGGISAVVQAWPAGPHHFWPSEERVPVTLSEFHDPAGQASYFLVPDPASAQIDEDELMSPSSR